MASTINALTGSGGIATTADSSGVLDLQSAGTTIATVSSAGIAMATGKTITGDAVSNGKILQVIQATQATKVETTSASFVATGLTADITVSAGNKVLILGYVNNVGTNGTTTGVKVTLFRGTTEINELVPYAGYNTSSTENNVQIGLDFLDASPATGSNTYSVSFLRHTGSATARVMDNNSMSKIILLEVAA